MIYLTGADVARFLRTPDEDDNKYRRGVVSLVTGSATYPGAGLLSVSGAAHCGAGMVRYLGAARTQVLNVYPETVFASGPSDAVVVGCGWDNDLEGAARTALDTESPVIIDAGALDRLDLWREDRAGPRILTPHYGEAARLWAALAPREAWDASQIAADPLRAGQHLARLSDSIVVLKGAWTHVVDPTGEVYGFKGLTGWAGVAGAGDVLAGAIGSLVAQRNADFRYRHANLDLAGTVAAAVWLHGHAAALAAGVTPGEDGKTTGGHPLLAHEIAEVFPRVWQAVI